MRKLDVIWSRDDDPRPVRPWQDSEWGLRVRDLLFLVVGQYAENNVELFQLPEPQQSHFPEQLGRVVNPHIPPRIAGDAQVSRLEHPTRLIDPAPHPRPELVDEDAISAWIEVVDGEEGVARDLGHQESFIAGQHLVPGLGASVEEAEEGSRAGQRRHAALGDQLARVEACRAVVGLAHQVDRTRIGQRIIPDPDPQLGGELSKAGEARRQSLQ